MAGGQTPRWPRRHFLAAGFSAGFAAAVAPGRELHAQVIHTAADGLDAGERRIPVGDTSMPAYVARPASPAAPGALPVVLVVHEAWGVHELIADVCRRLARRGYLAIAPELWFRQGDPRRYDNIADINRQVISQVSDRQVLADLDHCARWAAGQGGDAARLGVTGFCWGGRIVWLWCARSSAPRAGVAWYGRLSTSVTPMTPDHPLDVAETLKSPVLGLYGGQDDAIPLSTVDEMKTRLSFGTPASAASDIVVYPDAPHAFHADYRASYRAEAARDAWDRCLAWFSRHGVA